MTTSLHDRLADLADDAPPGGPAPGLWDRGRRYHRHRRVGTAVIATMAIVALVALGSIDWYRSRPAPVPANDTPALPAKIWTPNVWLSGTDEAGPLGQLAALEVAYRGSWTGRQDGVVGISAIAGEYRFLDLPDAVLGQSAVALAPDGRHVAYWYSGATAQSPHSGSGPVVGVAVYDTGSGEVVRHAVPTDHGLWAEDLVWADADRLVFSYSHYAGGDADDDSSQSTGTGGRGLLVWDVEDDTLTRLGDRGSVESSTGAGQLLLSGRRWSWLDVDRPDRRITFGKPASGLMYVGAVDERGTRVAWPRGDRNPNSVSVGRITAGEVEITEVPRSGRTFRVRAWLDAHRIAVDQLVGKGYERTALRILDVRTGEAEEVLRYPRNGGASSVQLAGDLLGSPSVDRPKPPDPLSPRKLAAGAVVVPVAGAGALLWWRRRVRP